MKTQRRTAIALRTYLLLAPLLAAPGCLSTIEQAPFDAHRSYAGQLPVFPGAQGFGTCTPAGRGGAVIRVTSLEAGGPGTLAEALSTKGPRTVVFEVGGVIDLRHALQIAEPFVTVAGQTAPEPGITLTGAGLVIAAHDVLVQHIRIRVGDRPEGPEPTARDGIGIIGPPHAAGPVFNVVVDHCSVSWAIDEGTSLWYPGVSDATFSQCIIAENLRHSLHPEGEHSKGLLVGDHARRVAVIGNLFAHNMRRNPLIKGDVSALVVNNLVYDPGNAAVHFSDPEGAGGSIATIAGNVLKPGPDTNRWTALAATEFTAKSSSRIYLEDNTVAGTRAAGHAAADVRGRCIASAPPVMAAPLTVLPSGAVTEHVLANAGARPAQRGEVDQRIVQSVRDEAPGIIDSQEEVGGFPSPSPTRRPLTLPASPQADDDGDGYTNLEEWLHALAADLETQR